MLDYFKIVKDINRKIVLICLRYSLELVRLLLLVLFLV